MTYGMSEMGKLINVAKVATAKAKKTDKPEDWYAAAEAWEKTNIGVEKADYCNRMGDMLAELELEKE